MSASSVGRETSSKRPLVLVSINFRKPKHHLGEVFTYATKLLLSPASGYGPWQLKESAILPFDLCFGESIARGIPYKGFTSNAVRPVVNFYQHFKALTWKLEMVLCLRK